MKQTNEHTLPDMVVIEEAILCTLLGEPSTITDVAGQVRPEMFSKAALRLIYSAILEHYNRGEEFDFLTVELEMQRIDLSLYEQCGGIGVLGDALHQMRHASGLPVYIEELKRYYLLRKLQSMFQSLAGQAAMADSDPMELAGIAGKKLDDLCDEMSGKPVTRLADAGRTLVTEFEQLLNGENKDAVPMIQSGFKELDMITGGFHPEELCVLAGRPADGKTAIALQIGCNAAAAGHKVAMFGFEMSNRHLMSRMFQGATGIDSYKMRTGKLQQADILAMQQAVSEWENWPFYIDLNPDNTFEDIRTKVLMEAQKEKFDLIIFDYLQLGARNTRPGETPNAVITETSRGLKKLAMQAQCAILVLSQLNRESEKRTEKHFKPMLADMRDSGAIEQDADMAISIYRPDRHNILTDPETGHSMANICQLMVLKNRHGVTGTVNIQHNGSFTRFVDEEDKI